jgi:hypothetical protein
MKMRAIALLLVLILFTDVNSYNQQYSKPTPRTIDLMIQKLRPNLDPEIVAIHSKYINQYSKTYGIQPEIVVSVAFQESDFDNTAYSNKGALGVMQVLPSAHKDKLKRRRLQKSDLFSLNHGYDVGCEILYKYIKQGKGLDGGLQLYVGGKETKYVRNIKRNISKCKMVI